jgi:hypothetical protein
VQRAIVGGLMDTVLLDTFTFWDVVWEMIIFFFLVLAIWVFIGLFADIFRRHDISGWAKAGWILLLVIAPILGSLIYIIARPRPTPEEAEALKRQLVYAGAASGPRTSTDDIAHAYALLQQGELTQAEFDQVKARALGTA